MALADAFVDIHANTDPFWREMRELQQRVARMRMTAEVDVTVDDRQVTRSAQQIRREYERMRFTIPVDVDVDNSPMRNLPRQSREVGNESGSQFSRTFMRAVRAELPDVIPAFRALSQQIRPSRDAVDRIRGSMIALDETSRTLGRSLRNVAAAMGPSLASAATNTLNSITSASGRTASAMELLVVAGTALAPQILAVSNQLGVLVGGSLAALPALLMGAAVGVGAVAYTFHSLKQAARPVADAMHDVQLETARLGYETTKPHFETLAKNLDGVKAGLIEVSGYFADATAETIKYVASSEGMAVVEQSVNGAAAAWKGIFATLPGLVQGFLQLSGAVSEAFGAKFGEAVGGALTKLGEFMTAAATSGDALTWVQDAVDVFDSLMVVISGVWGILTGLGDAAAAAGGDVLGMWGSALTVVSDFLNSESGFNTMVQVFTSLNQVAGAFGQILGAILTAVAPLLPVFAQLAAVVGEGLAQVIVAIAPSLEQLAEALSGALVQVMPQITQGFVILAQTLTILLPLLLPLLTWAIDFAADLVSMTGPLGGIVLAMGSMGAVIGYLVPGMSAFGTAMLFASKAFKAIVGGIRLAVTAIRLLSAAFMSNPILLAITAIIAAIVLLVVYWDEVTAALAVAWDWVANAVGVAVDWIIQAWNGLIAFVQTLPGLITGFLAGMWDFLVTAASTAVTAVVGFFAALPGRIVAGLAALGQMLWNLFTQAIGLALSAIGFAFAAIYVYVTTVPPMIIGGLIALGQMLWNWMTAAWALATNALTTAANAIVSFVTQLPGRILGAITALGGMLARFFTTTWQTVVRITTNLVNSLVSFVQKLPGRIYNGVRSLLSTMRNFFVNVWNRARSATTSGINAIVNFVQRLPGRVVSAISGLGGRIASVFTSAFRTARGIVEDGISGIINFFQDLPGQIASALQGFGSGIWSGLKSIINEGIDLVNRGINAFNKISPKNAPTIPRLANGAIVYSPTRALIGEAGPEAVIPLTRPRRALELSRQSGLERLILAANQRTPDTTRQPSATAAGAVGGNTFNVYSNAQDPMTVAYKTAALITSRITAGI